MKSKMRKAFQRYEGGLFSDVNKADVGDGFDKMMEAGVDMMSWADPFLMMRFLHTSVRRQWRRLPSR